MDWTEGHFDCRAGERGKVEVGGREVEGNGGGWNQADRAGESVSYNVFRARNVDHIAGEFGDVG